MTPLSLL
jgi:transposase, IS5 family